jgi:micrococcal nuclease
MIANLRWPGRVAAIAMAACCPLLAGACGSGPEVVGGRVERALDGDTVVVRGVGTVRYLGIDAPELHHPRRAVERFARQAWAANRRLVVGRSVRLVTDRESRDRYGRLLAYVYLGTRMVNAELVRLGLAEAYPFQPNTRHAGLFARLERQARRRGAGQWGAGEGGPPWGVP